MVTVSMKQKKVSYCLSVISRIPMNPAILQDQKLMSFIGDYIIFLMKYATEISEIILMTPMIL